MDDRDELLTWLTMIRTQAVVVERIEEDLERSLDMSMASFEVLNELAAAPDGRMRMQDLARSVVLSKSGVTRLVDRMAERGLVVRAACDSDRRVVYAAVTPQGRRLLADALPVHVEGVARHFAQHLSDADVRALRRALMKVLAAMGHDKPACPASASAVLGVKAVTGRAAARR